MADENENEFKVRLINPAAPAGIFKRVVFQATPDLIENRNVNYKTIEPVHMPGGIHLYNNTASRTFNIGSIKLVSRTSEEATKNLHTINVLRSWCLPIFGNSSTLTASQKENRGTDSNQYAEEDFNSRQEYLDYTGMEQLGTPPPVLLLSAYSNEGKTGNLYKVPTIILNLSIPYPSDVDYIPTGIVKGYGHIKEGVPVPILMTLDIQLQETHSPSEYATKFSIEKFRKGQLEGF